MAKILLFIPTYKDKGGELAMLAETRLAIDALDHGPHEVVEWVSVDEEPDRKNNIFAQYQKAWKRANEEDFDAILTIEHDMLPPKDALVKLAQTDGDIVYGVYLFRETGILNAFSKANASAFLYSSLGNYPDELAKAWAAGEWEVAGAGMGCTLFRRSVFSKLALRVNRGGRFPDLPLAADALAAGFRQVARFDVVCGHMRQDGFVLWPREDGKGWKPYMMTVKAKSNFVGVLKDGTRIRFIKGESREIPGEYAGGWARLGLIDTSKYRI